MKYEPKILVNKTGHEVEFFCGGTIHIFKPREQRPVDGFVAHHALNRANTGLTEVGTEPKMPSMPVDEMNWKQLRQMVGKDGEKVYKLGMNREELIKAIKENV